MPSLIVAVTMEKAATQLLTGWRQRFFPPERNYLPAHLMLYHRLSGEAESRIRLELAAAAAGTTAFDLKFVGLKGHAGFVGVEVEAPELHRLKHTLDRAFSDLLVPQDRQGYRPHVTLLNKVEPNVAAQSRVVIAGEFAPFTAPAVGLELHVYADGPWHLLESYSFA